MGIPRSGTQLIAAAVGMNPEGGMIYLADYNGQQSSQVKGRPAMRNRKRLSEDADPWEATDPALALAEQQRRWYARHRDQSRIAYQVNEVLILLAAATTLAAALQANPWVTASLAAGSLVLTGLRKIFDWHEDWVSFSSAWAELGEATHNYRLLAIDRRDQHAQQRLVGKVDEIISTETNRWASRRRKLTEDHD